MVLGQGQEHPYLQCHAMEIAKTLASAAAREILMNHVESLKNSSETRCLPLPSKHTRVGGKRRCDSKENTDSRLVQSQF